MDTAAYPLLDEIETPADLRRLDERSLPALADELRRFLIESVAVTGGHLGASLGTIELTVALHYVFDTPRDRLVWDVGHQTYGHKILTGRRSRMDSMRKRGGLAGFPNRLESDYDTFGVGPLQHTSISAALGMALAIRSREEPGAVSGAGTGELGGELVRHVDDRRRVVAVIGDGALTAGLAYEALNHAGGVRADMLVVLNDNDMSISPNVGAMNKYLARMMSGKLVNRVRARGGKKVLGAGADPCSSFARRTEEQLKGMVVPCTMFEELGFNYYGPVDGHDVDSLVAVMKNLRGAQGTGVPARGDEEGSRLPLRGGGSTRAARGSAPFDPSTGKSLKSGKSNRPTYTKVFGDWLCDAAAADERVVGITPAMREGSGLVEFEQRFPARYFDVGIAEQHSVTLAAGLACEGAAPGWSRSTRPSCSAPTISSCTTWRSRTSPSCSRSTAPAWSGPDGPTHAGSFDFSFMRCVPNMTIMAPADENECRPHARVRPDLERPERGALPARTEGPGVDVDRERVAARRRRGGGPPRGGRASRCSPSARWSRRPRPPAANSAARSSTCAS